MAQFRDVADDRDFCQKLMTEQSVFCLPAQVRGEVREKNEKMGGKKKERERGRGREVKKIKGRLKRRGKKAKKR